MTPEQWQKIKSEINALHEALRGRGMSRAVEQLYRQNLESLDVEKVRSMLRNHQRTSPYFPSPAELIPPADPRKWTGPGAPIKQSYEMHDKRAELAEWFNALNKEKKERIRNRFLRQTNAWNRERTEDLDMEKLGNTLAFRLFLQANTEGGD